jgi:hypothetical protein
MSVARTGLPYQSRPPALTPPAPGVAGVALDRTPSGNGHRYPAALASALPQDRTTDADPDTAAAPDARSQVRALVARERSGGPPVTAAEVMAVTGRRRRAYELLRDARADEGRHDPAALSGLPGRPLSTGGGRDPVDTPTTRGGRRARRRRRQRPALPGRAAG